MFSMAKGVHSEFVLAIEVSVANYALFRVVKKRLFLGGYFGSIFNMNLLTGELSSLLERIPEPVSIERSHYKQLVYFLAS